MAVVYGVGIMLACQSKDCWEGVMTARDVWKWGTIAPGRARRAPEGRAGCGQGATRRPFVARVRWVQRGDTRSERRLQGQREPATVVQMWSFIPSEVGAVLSGHFVSGLGTWLVQDDPEWLVGSPMHERVAAERCLRQPSHIRCDT